MAQINYPKNRVLGAPDVQAFPKVQYEKIKEMIDSNNDLEDRVTDLEDGGIAVDSITPGTGLLTVTGSQDVTEDLAVTGTSTVTGTSFINGVLVLNQTPSTRTGAGAVSLTTSVTRLVTTGANALTLADAQIGQIKIITMVTDGGDGTLTPTSRLGYASIKFTDVGNSITLIYMNDGASAGAWAIVANYGCTIA